MIKRFTQLNKNKDKICDFLFIIILFYGLLLRINYWGEQFRYWDSYRDYLIGHLIVQDGQYPQVGPLNGSFGFFSSPAYYYIISFILRINDNILFLEFVNILLHVLAIASIYLTARLLFSPLTGLIAVTLYSLNKMVLQEAFFVFQPFFAQPFLNIGLLLLVVSYVKKKLYLLILGNILVVLASAIHNSATTFLPVVLMTSILIIRKHKWGIRSVLGIILIIIVLFEVFYLPPIIYLNKHGYNILQPITQSFSNFGGLASGYIKAINVLTNFNANGIYASNKNSFYFSEFHTNFLFIVIMAVTIFYLINLKEQKRKLYLIIGIGLIISPIIFSPMSTFIQTRHFLVFLGPLIIIIAEVVRSISNRNFLFIVLKVLLIVLLVKNFSVNLGEFLIIREGYKVDDSLIRNPTLHIEKEILDIKQRENIDDLHFFDIFVYPKEVAINGYSNAAFWIELEKAFDTRFTVLDDSAYGFGYKTVNTNKFVIVICNYFALGSKWESCINDFLNENNDYYFIKEIYLRQPYKIYLVKQGE